MSATVAGRKVTRRKHRAIISVRVYHRNKPARQAIRNDGLHVSTLLAQREKYLQSGGKEGRAIWPLPIPMEDLALELQRPAGAEGAPSGAWLVHSRVAIALLGYVLLAWDWHRQALVGSYAQLGKLIGCSASAVQKVVLGDPSNGRLGLRALGYLPEANEVHHYRSNGKREGRLSQLSNHYSMGLMLRPIYARIEERRERGRAAAAPGVPLEVPIPHISPPTQTEADSDPAVATFPLDTSDHGSQQVVTRPVPSEPMTNTSPARESDPSTLPGEGAAPIGAALLPQQEPQASSGGTAQSTRGLSREGAACAAGDAPRAPERPQEARTARPEGSRYPGRTALRNAAVAAAQREYEAGGDLDHLARSCLTIMYALVTS